MDEHTAELNELFAPPNAKLSFDVLGELQSMLRLHSLEAQELFYKWESYCIKMGAEDTKLDLKTARDFKKDIQEILERESRGKQGRAADKKGVGATPRSGTADVFGMLDGLVPTTPRPRPANGVNGSTVKRKSTYETPAPKATKNHGGSSPRGFKTPQSGNEANGAQPFAERTNAGQVIESLNAHIGVPEPPENPPTETRVKLKANTELSKFNYKTMSMKLSETSEILDDRIDEFTEMIRSHHELEDSAFGNPAAQGTSDIVAVGRIASDTSEGRLNAASIVLETSRRTGGGLRVSLKVDELPAYNFFPGQIVALRGTNASGDFFVARELLSIPLLLPAASLPAELNAVNTRLQTATEPGNSPSSTVTSTRPLNMLIASGPYTTSTNLDLSPLHALLDTALTTRADVLLLTGPFLDTEHPALRTGSLDLPSASGVDPDTATLATAFRHLISAPLAALAEAHPAISIIVAPSVRDAVARHAAWPQDRLPKRDLGLPRQASCVTNPMTLSVNEAVLGVCTADPLDALRRTEVAGNGAQTENLLGRLARRLVEQRSFYPVFPPPPRESGVPLEGLDGLTEAWAEAEDEGHENDERMDWAPVGAMMDPAYLKLGEWLNVRPDVLVVPSVLTPFAKVVDSVLVVNPGTLSKRRGPGTYARLTLLPPTISDEQRESGEVVVHRLFERTRVDIVKI